MSQQLKDKQKQTEKEWDERILSETKAGLILEKQNDKKRKELCKEYAEQNKLLATEQKAK